MVVFRLPSTVMTGVLVPVSSVSVLPPLFVSVQLKAFPRSPNTR